MRLTGIDNIKETIKRDLAKQQVVYGYWFIDTMSDCEGSNMSYFTCKMTNVNTDVSVLYKCPFSKKKGCVEKTMMRVIECYNELVEHRKLKIKFNLLRHSVLQMHYENMLKDALFYYIQDKYTDEYYFDYKFNFKKNFPKQYTHISDVDCPDMLDNLELIEIED